MEYVFGTSENKEILKTKGNTHSNLSGFRQIVREYPDQTITDNFHVVAKIDSREDIEGNCYDWYEIDNHYRYTDKATSLRNEFEDSLLQQLETNADLLEQICDLQIMNGDE